jgi:subtilisin family serine protease
MSIRTRACQPFRFVPIAALAILGVALVAASGSAQSAARPHLSRITGTVQGAPLSQRVHTVVLKMAGDPVAVVRSRMPGKQLAEADRRRIETSLRNQQDAIVPAIEGMGGKVLAKFQHAINGIKVQGTSDQIKSFAGLPGVVQVKEVRTYTLNNQHSVPFIGAPSAWQTPPGLHGEHVRVAVIDTGVDYTHANFGGPGTVAAFTKATANSTKPADPALFGPNAPKVKGGIDLVGDAYDATVPGSVPVPDPNPLDCNGHGSHTSGTAAGFGVTSAGATFKGPYDAATPNQSFAIGPGVAPLADLYAVRVFGCAGSTNVVVDAIDWAVAHDMQVISMSLGADFGTEDFADAEASENAVEAGIVVAAASGNAGPITYVTSSPASGEKVISVAAMDSHDAFPGEALKLSSGGTILAIDANGIPAGNGALRVVVLPDTKGTGSAGVSLGCDPAEYKAAGVAGKLVVTSRGTCARVARAIYGQQAGAAAVAMINSTAGFPPYEGPINSNPDTGAPYTVRIPFLGVKGPSAAAGDAAALKAAASTTFAGTTIANPSFRHFASFSSAGPRSGDGHLKPDITAPGVSVFSTAVGTGNQGVFESGTSMATPHVAGSAALAIQAHPHWPAEDVAAAVVNTADSTQLAGYSPQLGGNGLVQPFGATQTSVIVRADDGTPSVSFGVAEFTRDFYDEESITLENHGGSSASFAVAVAKGPGSPHTATTDSNSVTVAGHEHATLRFRLGVPVATAGDSSAFRQVQGRIVLTPTSGNSGVTLGVPYYLVARARSMVQARLRGDLGDHGAGTVAVSNGSKAVAGTADFYAWGLRGDHASLGSIGLRAVGVQSYRDPTYGPILQFAVNTFGRASNPDTDIYDLFLDVNGDGVPDYDVEAADLGLLTSGTANGLMVVGVFDLVTGSGTLEFPATAPTDGTTVLLPLVAADVGITGANPRFSYFAKTTNLATGIGDIIGAPAAFNAFNSSISTGAFVALAPGERANVPVAINRKEFARTPALGEMVVSLDNVTKENEQAILLRLED